MARKVIPRLACLHHVYPLIQPRESGQCMPTPNRARLPLLESCEHETASQTLTSYLLHCRTRPELKACAHSGLIHYHRICCEWNGGATIALSKLYRPGTSGSVYAASCYLVTYLQISQTISRRYTVSVPAKHLCLSTRLDHMSRPDLMVIPPTTTRMIFKI